ncbi:Small auxin-up RNA [Sesbania bispinosa]|nr:Small auxin-up RNA [Sesbania bispinosa]
MFRSLAGKIQNGLSLLFVHRRPTTTLSYFHEDYLAEATRDDVIRKGYFAVVATKDGDTKRFIVKLDYLADPAFIRLLDKAREEYGFMHKGTLSVPCLPQDLQNILDAAGRS